MPLQPKFKPSKLSLNFKTPLIEAVRVSHSYEDKAVLQDISLKIHTDEIVTLIGPNGAGKSTLLKILLKLVRPTQGQVTQKPGLTIGFMPQKIQVDPTLPMTVESFLKLGLPRPKWFGAHLDLTHYLQIIQELEITDLLQHPIQKVSGGEMQRILLARALLKKPDLLVLDEPVQGVDLQGQTQLYHYINEIRQRYHCGILMVSHDLHIVMKNTDHVICLNQHICCSGHPNTVHRAPEYLKLFGLPSPELALYEHHHNPETCNHS